MDRRASYQQEKKEWLRGLREEMCGEVGKGGWLDLPKFANQIRSVVVRAFVPITVLKLSLLLLLTYTWYDYSAR